MTRLLVFYISVLVITFSAAGAGTEGRGRVRIQLINGDLISGVLLTESEELVEIRSPFFGVMSLSPKKIKVMEHLSSVVSAEGEPDDESSEAGNSSVSVTKKAGRLGAGRSVKTTAKRESDSSFRLLERWKKHLDFGMVIQGGRKEKSDYALRFKMERDMGADRFLGEYRYLYGKTNDIVSTDKVNSKFRWRHEFAPGVFYESNTSYNSDRVKGIDYILSQKLGVGYRLIETETMRLSSGVGASVRMRDDFIRDNEQEELFDFFQDWEYRFSGKVKLSQDLRFASQVADPNFYEIGFRAALISSITKTLNLTVRYEIEIDNSLPKEDREERRMVSSVGYDF